jgi:DNA-binding MarR family transcriptional regulator/N-acetylglutamate synthase-like GNAT family acetyltransferase
VAAVRSFNRFYTSRIGVLRRGYLRTRWTLGEARVIYELAQRDALEVPELRERLAIDAGYLSRVLARLERGGVVRREPSPSDRRRQVARLTARGRRAFTTLDERSAADTRALLEGVDEHELPRLVEALAVVRHTLGDAGDDAPVTLRAPGPGDLGWIVERHGALYAAEYDWDESFEALVAQVVAGYARDHDPEREAVWIAEAAGERVGCVMCVSKTKTTAQLRLLLVEPHARGRGIGALLVDECVNFARRAGYRRLVLWTNDPLADARRLYERAGFELESEAPARAFGHAMVEQNWSLSL